MIELRDYQKDAVTALENNEGGNPLIVLPTGTGKSVVIAEACRRRIAKDPNARIIQLTHVKELIQQNHDAMKRLWPEAPIGIVSAGLKRRDYDAQIAVCGIQTAYSKVEEMQWADYIDIDEAHLISRDTASMYGQFIAQMRSINPDLVITGYTATPYRMDQGLLYGGPQDLFSYVAYSADILKMIADGWLSPVTTMATNNVMDVTGVARRGGEFVAGQLQDMVNISSVTQSCVQEIMSVGESVDAKKWLVFCAGVEHAASVCAEFERKGVRAASVTGETPDGERDRILKDYDKGEIQVLTNVNVLTTGFDQPDVDLIALMRPTQSTGLHVQMIGRGLRIAPGKTRCTVLDFAGNCQRHGPIDMAEQTASFRGQASGDGEMVGKVCPACTTVQPAAVRICRDCGHEFPPPQLRLLRTASRAPVISSEVENVWFPVHEVRYLKHGKIGKPPTVKVEYDLGETVVCKWVCFNHTGYPKSLATKWWRERYLRYFENQDLFVPSVEQFVSLSEMDNRTDFIREPSEITIKRDGKYFTVHEEKFSTTEERETA